MSLARVRKGDFVQVTAGKDKGRTAKVIRIFPAEGSCIVEKVAVAKRHQKAKPQGGPSGIVEKAMRISLSKVMPFDEKSKKPSRVKTKITGDKKERLYVKSSTVVAAAGA